MKFPKNFLILFGVFLYSLSSFSQVIDKRNNMWAFGLKSGFDFNSGSPVSFVSAMAATYSCASVCDTGGQLLFYADHSKVYTKGHAVMPNGTAMAGLSGRQQTIVITPKFRDDSAYYIFMVNTNNRLVYSIVDMRLNGGLGDIKPGFKNIPVDSNQVEKLVVMELCGDMWLVAHDPIKPIFYAYDLKSPSSFVRPVISTIGASNHYGCHTRMTACSKLKKVNLLSHGLLGGNFHAFEDFDFDFNTGILSNCRLVDSLPLVSVQMDGGIYSPDYTKFYLFIPGSVIQYDMTLPSIAAIRASKVVVGTSPTVGQFRLAADGKIYLCGSSIGPACIERPNMKGLLCNLRTSVPVPISYRGEFGNDFMSYTVKDIETKIFTSTITLCKDSAKTLGSGGFKTYIWHDGDGAETKTFTKGGTYWRRAFSSCYNQIDTFKIIEDTPTHIRLSVDSVICFDTMAVLKGPDSYERYVWESGLTTKERPIDKDGKYFLEASKKSSCPSTYQKEYRIQFVNQKTGFNFEAIPDTSACPAEMIQYQVKTKMEDVRFEWKNGDTTASSISYGPGINWVKVKYKSCVALDSINIAPILPPIELFDTLACKGQTVLLMVADDAGASYLWNSGAQTSAIEVRENGTFNVVVKKGKCTEQAKAKVEFEHCSSCINVPNAFTPNNDGINDRFKPILICQLKEYEIKIFDRWGKQVFYSNNFNGNWDGTFNGQLLAANVYYYIITYSYTESGGTPVNEILKGDVTLIR